MPYFRYPFLKKESADSVVENYMFRRINSNTKIQTQEYIVGKYRTQ